MLSTPRLLIVDDEPVHRAFARAALLAAGWTVDEAEGGETALTAIAARHYALVLMDIQMPGADGFAVTRTIRGGTVVDRAVPVVAFTSLPETLIARDMADAGMDGYIAKPIPAARLAERVAPWWPAGETPTRRRLAATLGANELAALTDRFALQLADGLARIDEPGAATRAHRIAGLAGTLGFGDVYDAWLALSEEVPGSRAAAATVARRTLRALGA